MCVCAHACSVFCAFYIVADLTIVHFSVAFQPVTPEELEKASKISPLAMSLVKPPDPELLMGLKLKDQQELMMLHAEATLSQCSSRSSSRPSSQPGSRRGSFTTPDTLPAAGANTTVSEKGLLLEGGRMGGGGVR